MKAVFTPLNILSNTTITLRRLQSFRSNLWILLTSRNPSSLTVLKEKGWKKLLGDLPRVCEPLIKEFYANAILKNDYLDYWVRGHEFTLDVGDINDVLGQGDLDHDDFTPFKDRMISIETVQSCIGGAREGKCLNKTTFPLNLRCLTYIILFNLYPVRKLTTINNARAIFLMELRERIYINIGAHAFTIITEATRTTSSAKLVLPSLIMRSFMKKVWRLHRI